MSEPILYLLLFVLSFALGALFCALLSRRRSKRTVETAGLLTEAAFLSHAAHVGDVTRFAVVSVQAEALPLQLAYLGAERYDALTRKLSDALCAQLGGAERAAKTGEGVYCLLLKNRDADELRARLERLAPAFSAVCAGSAPQPLRFGIYRPQGGEHDAAAMLKRAIWARLSCPAGGGFCFYDPAWERARVSQQSTAEGLERALANGELILYLQPRVRALDGRVAGAEASVRWNHPIRGLLTPESFLPAAEHYGCLGDIDRFLFTEVCRLLAAWSAQGRELCRITVPLSRQSAQWAELAAECEAVCRTWQVECSLLELSFDEALLTELGARSAQLAEELHDRGFHVAVNGFGAAGASLALLNTLGADTVVLDQSFFSGKNDSRGGRYIVEAVLKLTSQLQIRTVAAGVSSAAQAQYLQRAACDQMQGVYFFKSLTPERFEAEACEGLRLGCAETPAADRPAAVSTAASAPAAGSVVLFTYRPQEDHIEFSEPFSPILAGATSIAGAGTLLRSTELIYDNDREDFFRLLERCQRESGWVENTLRFCLSEGHYGWLEVHMHQEVFAGVPVVSGTMIDIARWKREVERWKEKASRDVLTGLYNREHFEQTVQTQLEQKVYESAAVLFIDVDEFKRVNDTLGHQFGDSVLCYVAKQLLRVFRHTDVIARYGGDEFVVFAPSITWPVLEERLTRLCAAFRFPYRSADGEYRVSCSIGAAMLASGEDYATLLRHADCAVYEAKLRGRDRFVLYEPAMARHEEAARR